MDRVRKTVVLTVELDERVKAELELERASRAHQTLSEAGLIREAIDLGLKQIAVRRNAFSAMQAAQ